MLGLALAARPARAADPDPKPWANANDAWGSTATAPPGGEPSGPPDLPSTAANEPVVGVSPSVVPHAVARLTGAITGAQSGMVFRATVAPFSILDKPRRWLEVALLDLQASAATDTSTASMGGAKTTFAVATNILNPFSLRSNNANRANARCLEQYDPVVDAHSQERKFRRDVASAEAACAATRAAEQAGEAQASAPTSECAADRTACEARTAAEVSAAARIAEAYATCVSQKTKELADTLNREVLGCEWHEMATSWVPQIQVTGGVVVFPGGYYTDPAGKNSGLLLPYGGTTSQLTLTFRPHERVTLSAWGTYQSTRAGALPGTFLVDAVGASAQVSWLAFKFPFLVKKAGPLADAYVKTGFLPGLAVGASGQYLRCVDADPICPQGLVNQWSVTPFVDTKVSAALQFRVSVQVNQGPNAESSAVGVAPSVAAISSM